MQKISVTLTLMPSANRGDRRQPGEGGRDLDQHICPVNDSEQFLGLGDVASVSCVNRGSTSMDTRPSSPPVWL